MDARLLGFLIQVGSNLFNYLYTHSRYTSSKTNPVRNINRGIELVPETLKVGPRISHSVLDQCKINLQLQIVAHILEI